MLVAEIRRKLADLEELDPEEGDVIEQLQILLKETKEDLLTSDVFGSLKYLPRIPYLQTLFNVIGERNPHAENFKQFIQELGGDIESLDFHFWPSFPTPMGLAGTTTEPDVQISNNKVLIFFEAKLHSGFGELQIERELAVGMEQSEGREFFLVLVTLSPLPPRLRSEGPRMTVTDYLNSIPVSPEISKDVANMLQSNSHRVLWISWHAIVSALDTGFLLHSDIEGVRKAETRLASDMIGDLKTLMQMRGIKPFNGFANIANQTDACEGVRAFPWLTIYRLLNFEGINVDAVPEMTTFTPMPEDVSFFVFPWRIKRTSLKRAFDFSSLVKEGPERDRFQRLLPWTEKKSINLPIIFKAYNYSESYLKLFPWR